MKGQTSIKWLKQPCWVLQWLSVEWKTRHPRLCGSQSLSLPDCKVDRGVHRHVGDHQGPWRTALWERGNRRPGTCRQRPWRLLLDWGVEGAYPLTLHPPCPDFSLLFGLQRPRAARTGSPSRRWSSPTVVTTCERGAVNPGTGARGVPLAASGASCPGPSSGSAWGSSTGTACAASGRPQGWPWARASLPTVDGCAHSFQAFAARAFLGPPSVDPGCIFW